MPLQDNQSPDEPRLGFAMSDANSDIREPPSVTGGGHLYSSQHLPSNGDEEEVHPILSCLVADLNSRPFSHWWQLVSPFHEWCAVFIYESHLWDNVKEPQSKEPKRCPFQVHPQTPPKPKELCWFEVMDDLPLRSQLWKGSQLDQSIWDLVFLSVEEDQLSPTYENIPVQFVSQIEIYQPATICTYRSITWLLKSSIPKINQVAEDVQAGTGEALLGLRDKSADVASPACCVVEELQALHHQLRAHVVKACILVVVCHCCSEDHVLSGDGQFLEGIRGHHLQVHNLIALGQSHKFKEFLRAAHILEVEQFLGGHVDEADHGAKCFSSGLLDFDHLPCLSN